MWPPSSSSLSPALCVGIRHAMARGATGSVCSITIGSIPAIPHYWWSAATQNATTRAQAPLSTQGIPARPNFSMVRLLLTAGVLGLLGSRVGRNLAASPFGSFTSLRHGTIYVEVVRGRQPTLPALHEAQASLSKVPLARLS